MTNQRKSDEVRQAFAGRLTAAMRARGIPDRQRVGKLIGAARVSKEGARKWLTGMSIPDKPNMHAVAKLLGVREEWLEYGKGPMQAPETSIEEELLEGVRERLRSLDKDKERYDRLIETLRFLAER